MYCWVVLTIGFLSGLAVLRWVENVIEKSWLWQSHSLSAQCL
ncbi:MAG: hypothetical protein OFPI_13910 [Osedax symbiont Rs2]|nr:MAG: hypothetical protein OFPI_13910 [Osedax symbiont Rs2]